MTIIKLLSGAALLAIAGAATAQPGPRPDRDADLTRQQAVERADRMFDRLDANDDGQVSREDGEARRAQRRERRADRLFERLDLNRDGSITRAEVAQARARHGEQRAERGERRGMRGHRGGRHGFAMRRHRMLGEAEALTAEQFRARALERFDRADANHDGTLTAAERREAREQRRQHRGDERPAN
jgi:EF hand